MRTHLLLLVVYLSWSHIRCEEDKTSVESSAEKIAGNAIKDLLNEKISEKFKEAANEVKGVLVKQLGSSLKTAHTGMQKGQTKEAAQPQGTPTATPAPIEGKGPPGENVTKATSFYEKSKPTKPNNHLAGAAVHQKPVVPSISKGSKTFSGAPAVPPPLKDNKLKALHQGSIKPKAKPKHKANVTDDKSGAKVNEAPTPAHHYKPVPMGTNQNNQPQQSADQTQQLNQQQINPATNQGVMNQPMMPQSGGVPMMIPVVAQPCYGNMCAPPAPCSMPNCQSNMNTALFQPACSVSCSTTCLPFCPPECCKMKKKSTVSKKGQKKSKKN